MCAWLAAVVPLLALVAFLAAYRFDTGRLTDLRQGASNDQAAVAIRFE